MKISQFNYLLPESLIAINPPLERGGSRLLVLNRSDGQITDKKYSDLVECVNPGDVVVLNDTKVIKARIDVKKENGATRELIILESHGENEDWINHKVLYRGKISVGDKLKIADTTLIVKELLGDGVAMVTSSKNLLNVLEEQGHVPLPPYMNRKDTENDTTRYQTVWAKKAGSVAAPTASLNMTTDIIQKLEKKGVKICYLTLHVGLGTFLPIRTDDIEQHKMHNEYFNIPLNTINEIISAKKSNNKVIAVGTTVARTLEYSADRMADATNELTGEADIFIYPGYKFKLVDALMTNFHAPKSTVLMLAAAFAGWDNLINAYEHAIADKYHFLSYGDSMLIL